MVEAVTRLYLVSCAQTTLDRNGVFQGATDHKLSRKGTKHTKLLSRFLKDDKIDSFYSSPYGGAFATAATLAARHRRGVVRLGDLREMDFGKWTGKRTEQVKKSDPDQLVTWHFTPHEHRMPAGETLEEVQVRMLRALDRILAVEQGNGVCVVTHAIPAKAAMCHFTNEDLSIIWFTPDQESTALNIIDFEDGQARVDKIGRLEHLGEEKQT